jgi:hypothetical protein
MATLQLIRCKSCYMLLDGTLRQTFLQQLSLIASSNNGKVPAELREQLLDALNVFRPCCRIGIVCSPCLPEGIIIDGYNDPAIEQQFRFAGVESQRTPLALAMYKERMIKEWAIPVLAAGSLVSQETREIENYQKEELRKLYLSFFPSSTNTEEGWETHLSYITNRLAGNFNLSIIPPDQMEVHFHLYRYLADLKNGKVIFEICQTLKVPQGARNVPIPIVAVGNNGFLQHTYLQTYDKTFTRINDVKPVIAMNQLPVSTNGGKMLSPSDIEALFT